MAKKKKPTKQRKMLIDFKAFLFDFVKFTGAIVALIDLRPKVRYLNGKKPKGIYRGRYLAISNHVSFRDAVTLLVVFWRRRVRLLCTQELIDVKFWGPFFRGVGCIPIEKENPSMKAFKEIKETFDRGHIVGVFPEGSISQDTNLQPFKAGAAMIAILNGCDIVPMYIKKREKWGQRQLIIVGNRIKVTDYITSKIPTVSEIEKLDQIMFEKEQELAEYALKFIKK